MPTLYAPTTQNAIQKTLDASLDAGVTAAATFNNMTGVQNLPGIFVVDRVDSNGVETPSKREYISFQTTSGSNVQTLARGLAGSTDQDHAVGAIVEFIPDVTWAQDLRDHLTTEHNTDGTHKNTAVVMMTGNQTIAGVKTFSSSPIVPTPTTDLQAATKAYVDGFHNTKAYAYLSADQTGIANTTFTKIAFNTELFDIGSNFNTTNNRFVAPVTGYYLVSSCLNWVADSITNGKKLILAIYVNGTMYGKSRSVSTAGPLSGNSISSLVYLEATQYVEMFGYHDNGDTTPGFESDGTFVSVILMDI